MATVYVDEGGSSDIYRIERVYLDPDEAQRFTRDYNGTAPVGPVQSRYERAARRLGQTTARTGAGSGVARFPVSKRRAEGRHHRKNARIDDFDIRQEWWTSDACLMPRCCAGTRRGAKVEVVGLSKAKVEEIF